MEVLQESLKPRDEPFLWETDRIGFRAFVVYRCIVLAFVGTLFILDNLRTNYFTLFVYLTTWGFLFTLLFFFVSVLDMILFTCIRRYKESNFKTIVRKIAHFLFQTAFGLQGTITIVYWTFYAHFYLDLFPQWWAQSYAITLHGGMLIVLWLDYLISYLEIKRQHFVIVATIMVIYCSFNATYCNISHRSIYPIDYRSFLNYVIGAFGIAAGYLHFEVGVIYNARCKLKTGSESTTTWRRGETELVP
eukprot:TRINITY_DN4724_c0_g1_i2.p1 TRINITY_DN4724_c0_g1~~TRINITY_DN4724_c0_g1_i2.p1  ORF type:complete len:247 (+),score=4.67 TRINITY_DN4724_c0_g1_i2:98-838(+)